MAVLVEFTGEDNVPREVSYSDPLPVTSAYSGRMLTKTVVLSDAAGKGAVGTIPLFTVSGAVFAKIFAICTEDLASAGGTIETGIAGNTAALIPQVTSTTIDNGEIWFDGTPVVGTTLASNITERIITNGADIFATVAGAPVTDGTLTWHCMFQPIGTGTVVSA